MFWYYEMLEETPNGYIYKYSTDDDSLDGIIEYNKFEDESSVIRPSRIDVGSERRQIKARQSFANVILEGFPAKREVCCG